MAEKTYLDVNILVYWLIQHPEFGEIALEWILKTESGEEFFTSALSVYEVSVILTGLHGTTLRDQGFIEQVTDAIKDLNGLKILPLTISQISEAPLIMERYGLDYEDSLHLAAAMENEVTVIVSNDHDFDKTPMSRVF